MSTATKTKVKPLGDRVVVRPVTENERGAKTKSGIFIPETVEKERSEQGVVVAVGPGKMNDEGKHIPMTVKEGQTVLFSKYGPDEIKIDGKELFIISESSILAVIE
jgi:chaperonin GroES